MELIRLENIHKTYHLGAVDVPVLRGISLSIARGEMVALMGASGSGKTTLMNILGCLDRPSSGRYWLDGQDMSCLTRDQRAMVRATKLGFVFQSFNLLPRTTATQNVIMPLDYAPRRPGNRQSRQQAQHLLNRVALADRCDHEPSQMSGGQQQRVAIARSLINHPALLLADEPTGNLDSHASVEILRMFQQLNAEGITVILVTHDAKVAAYAHRTIRISDGLIEDDGNRVPDMHCSRPASEGHSERPAVPTPHALHGNDTVLTTAECECSWLPALGRREIGLPAATAVEAAGTVCNERIPKWKPKRKADTLPAVAMSADVEPKLWRLGLPKAFPSTLRTALGALRRNKMRSSLTALGVIIGVAAVIALTEFGDGSQKAIQKAIASLGADILVVRPGATVNAGVSLGAGTVQTLKPGDAEAILQQCPAVTNVALIVRARAQVVYGNRNWIPENITGTTPSYLDVCDWGNLNEGSVFTDHDVIVGSQVCVIGATLKRELFQDESPIGKTVRIRNVPFRVIGVFNRKGANMIGEDQDNILVAPWTTIKFRVNGASAGAGQTTAALGNALNQVNSLSNLYPGGRSLYPTPSPTQLADTPQPIRIANVDAILTKAASMAKIPQAIEQIRSLLRERHRLAPGRGEDFDIRDMTQITTLVSSTSLLIRALLLFVAAISLVVGGVGIMNIMLVSVTERTREIGLRMAVGARSHHILQQFLVEAVLLCVAGGAVGILVGRSISLVAASMRGWDLEVSFPAIVVAVLVSAGVGIIFGFYPAWKASRLDPIEALRYE